jgi:hypothetical protein
MPRETSKLECHLEGYSKISNLIPLLQTVGLWATSSSLHLILLGWMDPVIRLGRR